MPDPTGVDLLQSSGKDFCANNRDNVIPALPGKQGLEEGPALCCGLQELTRGAVQYWPKL